MRYVYINPKSCFQTCISPKVVSKHVSTAVAQCPLLLNNVLLLLHLCITAVDTSYYYCTMCITAMNTSHCCCTTEAVFCCFEGDLILFWQLKSILFAVKLVMLRAVVCADFTAIFRAELLLVTSWLLLLRGLFCCCFSAETQLICCWNAADLLLKRNCFAAVFVAVLAADLWLFLDCFTAGKRHI